MACYMSQAKRRLVDYVSVRVIYVLKNLLYVINVSWDTCFVIERKCNVFQFKHRNIFTWSINLSNLHLFFQVANIFRRTCSCEGDVSLLECTVCTPKNPSTENTQHRIGQAKENSTSSYIGEYSKAPKKGLELVGAKGRSVATEPAAGGSRDRKRKRKQKRKRAKSSTAASCRNGSGSNRQRRPSSRNKVQRRLHSISPSPSEGSGGDDGEEAEGVVETAENPQKKRRKRTKKQKKRAASRGSESAASSKSRSRSTRSRGHAKKKHGPSFVTMAANAYPPSKRKTSNSKSSQLGDHPERTGFFRPQCHYLSCYLYALKLLQGLDQVYWNIEIQMWKLHKSRRMLVTAETHFVLHDIMSLLWLSVFCI